MEILTRLWKENKLKPLNVYESNVNGGNILVQIWAGEPSWKIVIVRILGNYGNEAQSLVWDTLSSRSEV